MVMVAKAAVAKVVVRAAAAERAEPVPGNLSRLTFAMALLEAADQLDFSPVATLLRDPTVALAQEDRDRLAELLVPLQRGAKVRGALVGRAGRDTTVERDLAFYEALIAYRHAHKTRRIPADAKEEIAARFGMLDFETARKAEGRGKRRYEAELAARSGE
jgi:hypothetical protein